MIYDIYKINDIDCMGDIDDIHRWFIDDIDDIDYIDDIDNMNSIW